MSLILTELSEAGVAMAADSAITFIQPGGKIVRHEGWVKLLKAAKIKGGVSYWGDIGLIKGDRFDEWVDHQIKCEYSFDDPKSLAEMLAKKMNEQAGDKLIKLKKSAGVHVAGIVPWSDGQGRPVFYHVHNGHRNLHIKSGNQTGNAGSSGTSGVTPDEILMVFDTAQNGERLNYEWSPFNPTEFEVHEDFGPDRFSISEADQKLKEGYITCNGFIGPYFAAAITLDAIYRMLLQFPGARPHAHHDIAPRVGFLYHKINMVKNMCKFAGIPRFVDGFVWTLGIKNNGYYYTHDNFKSSKFYKETLLTTLSKKK